MNHNFRSKLKMNLDFNLSIIFMILCQAATLSMVESYNVNITTCKQVMLAYRFDLNQNSCHKVIATGNYMDFTYSTDSIFNAAVWFESQLYVNTAFTDYYNPNNSDNDLRKTDDDYYYPPDDDESIQIYDNYTINSYNTVNLFQCLGFLNPLTTPVSVYKETGNCQLTKQPVTNGEEYYMIVENNVDMFYEYTITFHDDIDDGSNSNDDFNNVTGGSGKVSGIIGGIVGALIWLGFGVGFFFFIKEKRKKKKVKQPPQTVIMMSGGSPNQLYDRGVQDQLSQQQPTANYYPKEPTAINTENPIFASSNIV